MSLELTRSLHVDIENSICVVINELENRCNSQRRRVYQDHRIADEIENEILEKSRKLVDIYKDENQLRKKILDNLQYPTLQKTMSAFDQRLAEIREYYRKNPSRNDPDELLNRGDYEICEARKSLALLPIQQEQYAKVRFSGEEGFGKYLDLHSFHDDFLNLLQRMVSVNIEDGKANTMTYIEYLGRFYQFHLYGNLLRKKGGGLIRKEYLEYLDRLLNYLIGFFKRTRPLEDFRSLLENANAEFNRHQKSSDGTPNYDEMRKSKVDNHDYQLESSEYTSTHHHANGVNGVDASKRRRKHHRRGKSNSSKSFITGVDVEEEEEGNSNNRLMNNHIPQSHSTTTSSPPLLLPEVKILKLVEALGDTLDRTKKMIERKQSRTWEENLAEIEAEEQAEELEIQEQLKHKQSMNNAGGKQTIEEEEEELLGKNANPLNIPLGYDGKPIPYWLYKLHGLGVEYKCEICGDYSYWGPRAFEKHFQEWRHSHGMRCLRIPNTKHFHQITKINEALQLWKKIKVDMSKAQWDKEQEEYEDKEGNVYSKKIYEDLERQQLL